MKSKFLLMALLVFGLIFCFSVNSFTSTDFVASEYDNLQAPCPLVGDAELSQNFPNPFCVITNFTAGLNAFTMAGQKVRTLNDSVYFYCFSKIEKMTIINLQAERYNVDRSHISFSRTMKRNSEICAGADPGIFNHSIGYAFG